MLESIEALIKEGIIDEEHKFIIKTPISIKRIDECPEGTETFDPKACRLLFFSEKF